MVPDSQKIEVGELKKKKPSVSALQPRPVLSINLLAQQVRFNLLIPAILLPT